MFRSTLLNMKSVLVPVCKSTDESSLTYNTFIQISYELIDWMMMMIDELNDGSIFGLNTQSSGFSSNWRIFDLNIQNSGFSS